MMSNKLRQMLCLVVLWLIYAIGGLPQSAIALDTANTLMGIDALVLNHAGLYRNATPNDGFNTFQFGGFSINNPVTTGYGRYTAFRWRKDQLGDCCISHNARLHSDTPESWDGTGAYPIWEGVDINSGYYAAIDRVGFGQLFDPAEYQIEVKFKPILTQATATSLGINPFPTNPSYPNIPATLENTAPLFGVGLDLLGGYVFDAETSTYKRANEGLGYNIGSAETPVNTWYASAPHDEEGFATFTVPVTQPSFVGKGFYYNYAQGVTRDCCVVTNGGRVQNMDGTWADVTYGFGENYQMFGGGPEDASRPGSKLNTPNGVPLISFGAPSAEIGVSIEIKSIALTRINPGPIVARLDSNSGITYRFGSALSRSPNLPPVDPPVSVDGFTLNPVATDQISRFDQNGMTNLFINARMPDAGDAGFMGYQYRLLLRGAASANKFDGENATVNIRARLTEPLTNPNMAQNITIFAKDLDGSDQGAMQGADEYTHEVALNQFNTSTFTTVSIPLEDFELSPHVPSNIPNGIAGSGPFGFANAGDGMLTDFSLYEFGLGVLPGGGLLRMELEYLEIRAMEAGVAGDFNEDGKVDAADYVVWRKNDVANSPLPNDNELASQAERYGLWRANYGNMPAGSGSLAGAAVPEPAAWLVAVFAAACFGSMRRRGR
jgi:hypothetical protein